MDEWALFGILLGLGFLIAFFEMCDISLRLLNPTTLKLKIADNDQQAKKLQFLLQRQKPLMNKIRHTLIFLYIGFGVVSYAWIRHYLHNFWPLVFAELGFILIVIALAVIIPRMFIQNKTISFLSGIASFLSAYEWLVIPLYFIEEMYRRFLSRFFSSAENPVLSEEDLVFLVDEAYAKGTLEYEERQLIQAAIEFDDMEVSSILTPRVDIVGLDIHAGDNVVRQLFQQTEFSRIVIYEEDLDDIIGILHVKDFNRYLRAKANPDFRLNTIATLLTEPLFVPPTVKLSELLHMMQIRRTHMAIVVDEHGGTIGIATMEDLLEELVGEIWDETDVVEQEIIKLDGEQCYSVSGRFELFKLFEYLGIDGDDDWISNTVNGFIIEHFERVPGQGECFEYHQYLFKVAEVGQHYIQRVIVRPAEIEESENEEEEEIID